MIQHTFPCRSRQGTGCVHGPESARRVHGRRAHSDRTFVITGFQGERTCAGTGPLRIQCVTAISASPNPKRLLKSSSGKARSRKQPRRKSYRHFCSRPGGRWNCLRGQTPQGSHAAKPDLGNSLGVSLTGTSALAPGAAGTACGDRPRKGRTTGLLLDSTRTGMAGAGQGWCGTTRPALKHTVFCIAKCPSSGIPFELLELSPAP